MRTTMACTGLRATCLLRCKHVAAGVRAAHPALEERSSELPSPFNPKTRTRPTDSSSHTQTRARSPSLQDARVKLGHVYVRPTCAHIATRDKPGSIQRSRTRHASVGQSAKDARMPPSSASFTTPWLVNTTHACIPRAAWELRAGASRGPMIFGGAALQTPPQPTDLQ